MTDERSHDTPQRGDLPAEIERDLAQWRAVTSSDVPDIRTAVARARLERAAANPWRSFMNSTRPWFVPAAVTAVLAVALLVVPVSYEHVTGDRVTLALAKTQDPAALVTIAQEMKSALHASGVRVESRGEAVSFVADVPRSSGVPAARAGAAFASALEKRGYQATVATAPIREKVTGSVYAFARDVVIKVDVADKSAAQIESEIRSQLENAGIPDARVSVMHGDKQEKVTMELPLRTAGSAGSNNTPANVKIALTKNGEDLAGKGHRVLMRMEKAPDGGRTLHLTVGNEGQEQTFDIEHTEAMNDAQLEAAITDKFRAAGLPGSISVQDGHVTIEPIR